MRARREDIPDLLRVLVRVSIAVMKHHGQCNLGRKGFVGLPLSQHFSSLKKSGQEMKEGRNQEPGGRS